MPFKQPMPLFGAPPMLPPTVTPVKVGGPRGKRPQAPRIDYDAALVQVATQLDASLRADIDRIVADMEARGIVAKADVWGQGQQYVRGCAALWGK